MKEITFRAAPVRLTGNACNFTVIYIPQEIVDREGINGRPRIIATIGGHTIKCALIPGGEGTYFIMWSLTLQRLTGIAVGHSAEISFTFDDPNAVDVPEELERALARSKSARKEWDTLTPGKRRGLAYRVASARTEATRKKRVAEVLDMLQPLRFTLPED